MKRICILGENGQLGSSLKDAFAGSSEFEIICPSLKEVDFIESNSIQKYFSNSSFDIVINCAAYTAVDQAEKEIALNDRINNLAIKELSDALAEKSTFLIHISTDFVFDGTQCIPLTEEKDTNPLQEYGKSKLLGEQWIVNGMVIRTAWLYSIYGSNFVKTMMKLGRERSVLKIIDNQVGSPTNARDLAEAIKQICLDEQMEGKKGIYHFSNEGVASWYDFACTIMEYANISCKVIPIPDSEYPTPAKRPSYSVMDKTKVKSTFGVEIPYWRDSLRECINKLKDEN